MKHVLRFLLLPILALTLSNCSKDQAKEPGRVIDIGAVEHSEITSTVFKNCHFKTPAPAYAYNAAVTPNTIQCDEGVARRVELLSANPLPAGLQFSTDQLALVGTPTEKMVNVPYEFYLENEAGYARIKVTLTVK